MYGYPQTGEGLVGIGTGRFHQIEHSCDYNLHCYFDSLQYLREIVTR